MNGPTLFVIGSVMTYELVIRQDNTVLVDEVCDNKVVIGNGAKSVAVCSSFFV